MIIMVYILIADESPLSLGLSPLFLHNRPDASPPAALGNGEAQGLAQGPRDREVR
jgi:hypothetical protein